MAAARMREFKVTWGMLGGLRARLLMRKVTHGLPLAAFNMLLCAVLIWSRGGRPLPMTLLTVGLLSHVLQYGAHFIGGLVIMPGQRRLLDLLVRVRDMAHRQPGIVNVVSP